ncbi:hypothetical protein N7481_008439 [Penicillium waksmanii]|uniref:uncharacterized protein n=1 Tax=Penicillium waksmanii TaxID=69791 RepID=UPI0025486A76|nr:uncharacterized protein N7481_008439 [Penicillium waksmanii]KAJ5981141.1 hypothetical protein N7481_008439 [Penicillium waksmanii]
MPVEILEAIAILLKPSEFRALRLACRDIYESTTHSFGREFLKTVHFDLSQNAIERLSKIAENPHLRQHVQLLVIQEPEDNLFGRGISWTRDSSGHLAVPEKAVQQWQTVLSRLVNCKGFEIRREHSFETSDLSGLRSSEAIAVVLGIIAEASIPVSAFAIHFKPKGTIGSNHVEMECLSSLDLGKQGFIAAWAHVQDLSLQYTMGSDDASEALQTADWTIELVQYATRLIKLDLNFDLGDQADSIIRRLSTLNSLCQLQELTLESFSLVSEEALPEFLYMVRKSLQTVSFSSSTLPGGCWISILKCLGSEFPSLKSINLQFLRGTDQGLLHFPRLSESPDVDEGTSFTVEQKMRRRGLLNTTVGYSGPSMGKAISILVECATFD